MRAVQRRLVGGWLHVPRWLPLAGLGLLLCLLLVPRRRRLRTLPAAAACLLPAAAAAAELALQAA